MCDLAPVATWQRAPRDDDTVAEAMTTEPARKGILELLDHGSTLKTPAFQRSFAWGDEQVIDYWDDLKRAIDHEGGSADYFLGLVVVDEDGQIQDGQQRLATTLLLAAEIYHAAEAVKALGEHTTSLAAEVAAFVSPALRRGPKAPLNLGLQDQSALLERTGIRVKSLESVKRLDTARERLKKLVAEEIGTLTKPDERLRRLRKWGDFLRTKAYVVLLQVPPRDAHNIFETLNTRGVRLSNGDLVKSHLIARSDDTPAAVKKWGDITGALQDEKGNYESDLESFLLHYYGSKYGKTVKRDLFADYRPHIADKDPITALEELHESAVLYHALADPEGTAAFWLTLGPGTREAIQLINGLGLKQLRYLLLSILRDFGSKQSTSSRRKTQAQAVLKIVAWSVRGLVHLMTGGGDAEKTYIDAAAGIRDGSLDTVTKLREFFVKKNMLVLDDDLFKDAFSKFAFDSRTSHTRARAILYALEYHQTAARSALTPRDTLTVEHVLPLNPEDKQWAGFDDDARAVYAHRLGNLLLIDGPSGANSKLGNKEWPDKRNLIRTWGPQTPLTQSALKKQAWTKEVINARHEALATLATKAFAA